MLLMFPVRPSLTEFYIVSEDQKRQFRDDPDTYLQYRKEVEQELNTRFKFVCASQRN